MFSVSFVNGLMRSFWDLLIEHYQVEGDHCASLSFASWRAVGESSQQYLSTKIFHHVQTNARPWIGHLTVSGLIHVWLHT